MVEQYHDAYKKCFMNHYLRSRVLDLCKLSSRQFLDQMLDFENDGVSKHLGEIADSMYEWEGPVAEQLDLTPADIAAIKTKYPDELRLQM